MTLEISECGVSIVTSAPLAINEQVEIHPVGGGRVKAIVRRGTGKLYGLEFLNLSTAQVEAIRKTCKMLPLFNSRKIDLWRRGA